MTSKRDQRIALAVVGIILGGQVHPNSASGSEPPKALKERTPGGAATLFPDQDPKNQPVGAAAQEKVRATPDSSADPNRLAHTNDAVRSRFVVLPSGRGDEARAVVALGRPANSNNLDDLKGTVQFLLYREVIRQAVLIAARDGLGLGTRDEVLGDRPPDAPGDGAAEIVSNFRMDPGASRMFILRGHGDQKAETLLRHDLLASSAAELDYLPRLTTLAESLSRTELPAALKALGLKGEPNRYRADAALPAQVEDRLDQLGFVENVTAVRDLHQAIRNDGESPGASGR